MAEKTTSLAVQAYEKIKENILNLTYPPGTQLTEAMLTRELGMSRSPIRSAIQMLQTEGLIVSDYYKSMTVREITDQDINELYQIRELLEGAAFKLIFSSGRNEEYSYRIEEKVVRMCAAAENPYRWEIADTAMHMEIISIFRIGQYSVRNGMQITKTNENLKKMIEYMRNGKSEESYEILKTDHFDTGRHSALKAESIEHITQST